jgi:hypothetical protein
MDPRRRAQSGDQPAEQIAVPRALAQELARSTADLAGRIAQTDDEVVRVHEEIARRAVSAPIAVHALQHAARAGRFAEHKPREQQR